MRCFPQPRRQRGVPEQQDIMKKLKEIAFPRTDELKRDLLKKYNMEYQEYLQSKTNIKLKFSKKLTLVRLTETERKQTAPMRQQKLEWEQFLVFEDQLKKQELAREQILEQIHGTALSCFRPPQNNSLLNVPADQPDKSDAINSTSQGSSPKQGLKAAAYLSAAQHSAVEGLKRNGNLWKLTQDEFTVIHVVMPKQSAGPDYCDTEKVEELFHTHSTQTAVLSRPGRQRLLTFDCSPKHKDSDTFRLTRATSCLGFLLAKRRAFTHQGPEAVPSLQTCLVNDIKITGANACDMFQQLALPTPDT
ncbi:hypothetical protein E2I00_018513 [Balaenoptera physalus]|uniref:Uncharacterized protein n=1 Tax=Balaenoptera physalus TaxID=9770 RepID=A0A6A1Q757_BALPH|nr:hypothetical protein E2I00_018513 [Balaenoptera physalus]